MKFCVIISAHNEAENIISVLHSFINQTLKPTILILVDDNSTDNTYSISSNLTDEHEWMTIVQKESSNDHLPGTKIINAFYYGLGCVNNNDFDFIGKFDADIILPNDYFEKINILFKTNLKSGIAGGNLYIKYKNKWIFENISSKKKVRGPIKLYRKECFEQIGGLKKSIGWDTVDELLAKYHGWEVCTDETLHVKHLKPTGANYSKSSKNKQGEAFYKMRYGFWLTLIASAKLAFNKKSFLFFINCMQGYFASKKHLLQFIVSEKEGKFIRKLRWEGIKKKLF